MGKPGVPNLKGRVALVTGGAVRIGRALALALARQGASVVVHYGSSSEEAAETVAAIRGRGGAAEAFQSDLRDLSKTVGIIELAAECFGTPDILVNSAAVYNIAELADTTESQWDEHFSVNLKAPFFLARAFATHLGRERAGQIVNIADWRGVRPDPRCMVYSLTKAGIISMTEGLALALAPNIRVNAIAPGAILPPPGRDEEYLKVTARHAPLGKAGSSDQVVDALLYLVTAESVTGQVLFVDGGEHLGSSK